MYPLYCKNYICMLHAQPVYTTTCHIKYVCIYIYHVVYNEHVHTYYKRKPCKILIKAYTYYIYMHCIHTYIYAYIYMYIYIYHVPNIYIHKYIYIYLRVCVYVCVYIYAHAYVRRYTYTHTRFWKEMCVYINIYICDLQSFSICVIRSL